MKSVDLSLVHADQLQEIELYRMPQLELLWLTPITAEGSIEDIQYVANIDDSIVDSLTTFSSLNNLSLRFSKLTDAGLSKLSALPKLKSISISGPNISAEAVQQLRQRLTPQP
jgi:hypothetical protein